MPKIVYFLGILLIFFRFLGCGSSTSATSDYNQPDENNNSSYPEPTFTPTAIPTAIPTAWPTAIFTATPTYTPTPNPTPIITATPSPTPVITVTPSPTPTLTPIATATPSLAKPELTITEIFRDKQEYYDSVYNGKGIQLDCLPYANSWLISGKSDSQLCVPNYQGYPIIIFYIDEQGNQWIGLADYYVANTDDLSKVYLMHQGHRNWSNPREIDQLVLKPEFPALGKYWWMRTDQFIRALPQTSYLGHSGTVEGFVFSYAKQESNYYSWAQYTPVESSHKIVNVTDHFGDAVLLINPVSLGLEVFLAGEIVYPEQSMSRENHQPAEEIVVQVDTANNQIKIAADYILLTSDNYQDVYLCHNMNGWCIHQEPLPIDKLEYQSGFYVMSLERFKTIVEPGWRSVAGYKDEVFGRAFTFVVYQDRIEEWAHYEQVPGKYVYYNNDENSSACLIIPYQILGN